MHCPWSLAVCSGAALRLGEGEGIEAHGDLRLRGGRTGAMLGILPVSGLLLIKN